MGLSIEEAVSRFGERAKAKLANPAASGQPEDQLRSPFEVLLSDVADVVSIPQVEAVGESSLADIKTRPDYAVTVQGALVGFVELKAPGKGADPRRFTDKHDREQWDKLRSLPNLLYADGNSFALWRDGNLVQSVVTLGGDVQTAGKKLTVVPGFVALFQDFLQWKPIAPHSAKELAETTARLCRLLRDEVTEQLAVKSPGLTNLAEDWRKLLFPEANDKTFADGYAQAVTFGMLMARAKNIRLADGMSKVATELAHTSSLIGTALRLLTDNDDNQAALKTALGTLTRVLDAVDWTHISKGNADAWLYFYEDFLAVYDNELRKLTGSYYTPPEVVAGMVSLVDEALRSKFALQDGLADSSVTLADPATGTGTFFLGALKSIVETVKKEQGAGAVGGAVTASLKRLIAFEMQLGPFAVAQLRILAEIVSLTGKQPKTTPRMFVTNTLSDPEEEAGWIPQMLAPLANQRKDANHVMRKEAITVVLGNPPYKEKAKGKGSWVESGAKNSKTPAPLQAWMPPKEWKVGVHSRHLRNLYVYFWRWATWKVFDHGDGSPGPHDGIVCFITASAFLSGSGFQQMRAYLRQTCEDIWVIDCSPEGHQPEVNTRIFQGVQQPICIVLASRTKKKLKDSRATVHFRALVKGRREDKFTALASLRLSDTAWLDCPAEDRAAFLPKPTGSWSKFPKLESLFVYNGSGVQPKRTWVIAPDIYSLRQRWLALVNAPVGEKEALFHPTLRNGIPADRHIRSVVKEGIPGFPGDLPQLVQEAGDMVSPVRFGFRSFDRQWIIPDARVITQPNAFLWASRSNKQVYLSALSWPLPSGGPAVTFSDEVPDLNFYKGSSGGRVLPLFRDSQGSESNLKQTLLQLLADRYQHIVEPADFMAYIAAIAGHPGYTSRFRPDFTAPGLRLPITADLTLFKRAVRLGKRVIWLQTYGERMVDASDGRPNQAPRLPDSRKPTILKDGAIPEDAEAMPDTLVYDPSSQRLAVGSGFIENVTPAMWAFEVSGKQVLIQWFSYRKKNRERPIIGDRRLPSKLSDIQPDHWLAEYTTELLKLLNVLGGLIDLEAEQALLLDEICQGAMIAETDLKKAGVLEPVSKALVPAKGKKGLPQLF